MVVERTVGAYWVNTPLLGIPATLQDALMARLDRLGTAKEVAQQGAAVGRELPTSYCRQSHRSPRQRCSRS